MTSDEKEIAKLDEETAKLRIRTSDLKAQLIEKKEEARKRLLNEFGECFSGVYAICDDYRNQELRFIHSFALMRDEGYMRLQAIKDECASLGGKDHD